MSDQKGVVVIEKEVRSEETADSEDKKQSSGTCLLPFMWLMTLAFSIASLVVYAHGDSDSERCTATLSGTDITISTWLLVDGITGLYAAVVVFRQYLCASGDIASYKPSIADRIMNIFFFCWAIMGFVLLFRDNARCWDDRVQIGVYMACRLIIDVGFVGLELLMIFCCAPFIAWAKSWSPCCCCAPFIACSKSRCQKPAQEAAWV